MDQKIKNSLPMGCHLLGLTGIVGPLIIWLIKKDESALVDKHGKESLNFQISIMIYLFIALISAFVLIGFILVPIVIIFNYAMVIMATVKVNNGEDFRYPFCLRLIK